MGIDAMAMVVCFTDGMRGVIEKWEGKRSD
jgi:uncharacterized protein YkvS